MHKTILRVVIALAALLVIIAAVLAIRGKDRQPAAGSASYTLAQVAEASTTARCWVAIESGVYDFTPYAAKDAATASLCGTDATAAVQSLGGYDEDTFESALIGELAR